MDYIVALVPMFYNNLNSFNWYLYHIHTSYQELKFKTSSSKPDARGRQHHMQLGDCDGFSSGTETMTSMVKNMTNCSVVIGVLQTKQEGVVWLSQNFFIQAV